MTAYRCVQKDGNNTTIATHEDVKDVVPGGYNNGDTMNANHEFEYDFDVNDTDRTFLVLGGPAAFKRGVGFQYRGVGPGDDDRSAINTTLGTDLVIKDAGGNTVTRQRSPTQIGTRPKPSPWSRCKTT